MSFQSHTLIHEHGKGAVWLKMELQLLPPLCWRGDMVLGRGREGVPKADVGAARGVGLDGLQLEVLHHLIGQRANEGGGRP
jgi:hypothetical protein